MGDVEDTLQRFIHGIGVVGAICIAGVAALFILILCVLLLPLLLPLLLLSLCILAGGLLLAMIIMTVYLIGHYTYNQ